ncbi:MAG: hypothetical protein GX452_04895 [Ignavibacteriales bacterium]|nr:hypothetical protein [Ignavibacteriales bacterium]
MKNRETVDYAELVVSNMLEIQAIIHILERRGITSEAEILTEIKVIRDEMNDNLRKMQREN